MHTTLRDNIVAFIQELSKQLHAAKMKLIITIYLHKSLTKPFYDGTLLTQLQLDVDYFNVLSYEFGQDESLSPIGWSRSTLKTIAEETKVPMGKILMGVPFFSYTYSPKGPLAKMGTESLRYLNSKEVPHIKWNEETAEHTFVFREYQEQIYQTIYLLMPTLAVPELDYRA